MPELFLHLMEASWNRRLKFRHFDTAVIKSEGCHIFGFGFGSAKTFGVKFCVKKKFTFTFRFARASRP